MMLAQMSHDLWIVSYPDGVHRRGRNDDRQRVCLHPFSWLRKRLLTFGADFDVKVLKRLGGGVNMLDTSAVRSFSSLPIKGLVAISPGCCANGEDPFHEPPCEVEALHQYFDRPSDVYSVKVDRAAHLLNSETMHCRRVRAHKRSGDVAEVSSQVPLFLGFWGDTNPNSI